MSKLILMRHAKSSWKNTGQRDHERPLNPRGQADAPAMGRRLVDAGWKPDLALISDAARTEETWAWMRDGFEQDVPFKLVSELYLAPPQVMIEVLRSEVDEQETVLILAHNPGLEDAILSWTGELLTLRTSNAVLLDHTLPWAEALGRHDWRMGTLLTAPSRDAG